MKKRSKKASRLKAKSQSREAIAPRTWKAWVEDAHGYIVAMEDLESARGVNVDQERELIQRYEELKKKEIKPRRGKK